MSVNTVTYQMSKFKQTPYPITDWDWFRVKLDIHALQTAGTEQKKVFELSEGGRIRCVIYNKGVQRLIDANKSQAEQWGYYKTWVDALKINLRNMLDQLPTLSSVVDLESDLIIEIAYDYGTGAAVVCRIQGDSVQWTG